MLESRNISLTTILWQGLIFWAVTFTALEAPYSFVFQTKIHHWQLWVDGIISFMLFIDFMAQILAIKKAKRPQVAMGTIFFLTIDFFNVFPFEIIAHGFALNRGLKFLYVLRLFRMIRIVKFYSFVGKLTVIPKWVKIQMMIVFSIIAIHWVTCGWIYIYPLPAGKNPIDYYVLACYWAVTTLTTIGYGDITPSTTAGRIYTMGIMILGVGVYGVVIGNVASILQAADRFKEQAREKLSDLENFMKHYNIPPRLRETVFSYYSHLLGKRMSDNDVHIIADLPHALQQELQTYMNVALIRSIPIFSSCGESCLKDVARVLEQNYFSPGQTIINIGDIGHEMYIIAHGQVDVLAEENLILASLTEGQFFGEMALLEETKRTANVQAHGYCDLYKLKKEDFLTIIRTYPELKQNIEGVRKNRQRINIKR